MKKLPTIAIEGIGNTNREQVESLIAIEPILVSLGYKSDEKWNNSCVTEYIDGGTLGFIHCNNSSYEYHSHPHCATIYKADNPKKLISDFVKCNYFK